MLKQLAFRAMEGAWFARALERLGRPSTLVLFMHRFGHGETERGRHDPRELRTVLQKLRRANVALIGLDEAVAGVHAQPTYRGLSVSFTVDDGYADFAELGWPVFKEFDCPVSLFVVPSVIEGKSWFWWDKLDWLMRHDQGRQVRLSTPRDRFEAGWRDERSRFVVFERACVWLKHLSFEESERALSAYAELIGNRMPSSAPSEYRVLSWDELRRLEREGLRVGAHTMTHPVLSRCDDERMRWEITESLRVVSEQLASPTRAFCYPNGQPLDHGEREWRVLETCGVPCGLTTSGGVLPRLAGAQHDEFARFRLPRVSYQAHAGRIIRSFVG